MRRKLDLFTLLISAVAGFVWWMLGGLLYRKLLPTLWPPLVIALYFVGLALFLIVACVLAALLRGYSMPEGGAYGKSALVALAILLAAGIFQYLYSLDTSVQAADSSSYIFLLDDSGSMSGNDPNMARAAAVKKVVEKEQPDFPFAVYTFASDCRQIVPITRADMVDTFNLHLSSGGGTDITNAIETILSDLESGALEAGENPRIILLSDGESINRRINKVLKRAFSNNVSISTIGLGCADEAYLRQIAEYTRGVYIPVGDIDDLESAMQTAAVERSSVDRTLVGLRQPVKIGWLYGILRCVFLTLLGGGFLVIKSQLLRTNDKESNMLLENALAVLIGALIMELLTNGAGLGDGFVRFLLCVCFSLLLTTRIKQEVRSHARRSYSVEGEEDNWTTGRVG